MSTGPGNLLANEEPVEEDLKNYGSCPICLEDFNSNSDLETGQTPKIPLESCSSKHVFCIECMIEYCLYMTSVRNVPILCPQTADSSKCDQILSDELVQQVLMSTDDDESSESWIKYHRFKRLAQDPTLIPCPRCDELVPGNTTTSEIELSASLENQDQDSSEAATSRFCPSCSHTFCSVHGDSHPSMSCAEFLKTAQAKQIRKSEKSLKQWTKQCSHCGAHLQKAKGCDYVVCGACRKDMCWRCGTHVHMTGEANRLHCAKCHQKYPGHRRQHVVYENNWQYKLWSFLLTIGFVIFTIIWIPMAIGIGILSGCFGCCFGFGQFIHSDLADVVPRFTAIRVGFVLVFLPLLLVLQAAGYNFPVLDGIEGKESEEIPAMPVGGEGSKKSEADDAL